MALGFTNLYSKYPTEHGDVAIVTSQNLYRSCSAQQVDKAV